MNSKRNGIDRRGFLQVAAAGVVGTQMKAAGAEKEEHAPKAVMPSGRAVLRVRTDAARPLVPFLSWDTEGGDRVQTNLLGPHWPLALRVKAKGGWLPAEGLPCKKEVVSAGGTRYRVSIDTDAELVWEILPGAGALTMKLIGQGAGVRKLEGVRMDFPFNPRVTPTTLLPSVWAEDGTLQLPAIITAPDFGQMLLTEASKASVKAQLHGSRACQTVRFSLEFPEVGAGKTYSLRFNPVYLPPPKGLKDTAMWRLARRGWWNIWTPSSQWGEQDRPRKSAPAGLLANNVISDPVSVSLFFYADHALWTPELALGISIMTFVRTTLDWWLDKRTHANGEVIGYWDESGFLDANASLPISAWDYVEATGDQEWLARRIERLEFVADYLVRRDVDGDGLVEAIQSGNAGDTLIEHRHSCAWWDAINCGHKDGYTNAVIYRSWRCLADLEGKLGRVEKQTHYDHLADRLKAVYVKTLYNPKTGWLGWWRSEDGELHDFASPIVNGIAIEYGLVEPVQGREILKRIWDQIRRVGFTRFDLGIPPQLTPVPRADFANPNAVSTPVREDGKDTFQYYMNGGIAPGRALHFLAAHYVVGEPEKADRVLRAMLGRQQQAGFHNGVVDKYPYGADWLTWDGKPAGYEGYLSDMFYFLLAVVLREPALRTKYYRPMAPHNTFHS